MSAFQEYSDPRLVAVYDAWAPSREDAAFYLVLASALSASSIIDLGCGTGAITCELARRGHGVTGVDPSSAMLAVARSRAGGELVTWVEGDAGALADRRAELVP